VRSLLLLALVLLAAGCGSSSDEAEPTTTAAATRPSPTSAYPGTALYEGGDWAVVTSGDEAVALHFAGGEWRPDRSGTVKVEFLGPDGRVATATPQVAAQLSAPTRLAESALWVDGVELLAKGGGLTPTKGTIYGAPSEPLAPGKHVAVAYARTATAGTAVAKVFTVR
jgi:hypothetical protein